MDKYQQYVSHSKTILYHIYQALADDASSAPTPLGLKQELDESVAKAILETDAPELILDQRKLIGNPQATHFDDFWMELLTFLEEVNSAVDDCMHGEILQCLLLGPSGTFVRSLWDALLRSILVITRLLSKMSGLCCSLDQDSFQSNCLASGRDLQCEIHCSDPAAEKVPS